MTLELEQGQIATQRQEPPKRVLDASEACFPGSKKLGGYGYQSGKRTLRAVSESVYINRVPHVLIFIGSPIGGKEHAIRDFASRLYFKDPDAGDPDKRGEGVLQVIEKERQPHSRVPIDYIPWGPVFSLLKSENLVERERVFGQFGDVLDLASDRYRDVVFSDLEERQGELALLLLKTPTVAAARFNGELFGPNLGYTALEEIIRRKGRFRNLEYKTYVISYIQDPDVEMVGSKSRIEGEQRVDNPKELVEVLKSNKEIVLLSEKDTHEDLANYFLDSANQQAAERIELDRNNLIVRYKGREWFRYREDRDYWWDQQSQGYRFRLREVRKIAAAFATREILEGEENFGLTNCVFLGYNNKLEKIVFDRTVKMRDVIRECYPGVRGIRNK